MEIKATALELSLHRPFTIARGSRTTASNVLVEVHHEDRVGRGEAAPSPRYGQSQESALAALSSFAVGRSLSPFDLSEVVGLFSRVHPGETFARSALEAALWDWIGQDRGLPLHRMLAIDPGTCPVSSFTISIDDVEGIEERVAEVEGWPVLKLKLGGGDEDARSVEALRAATDLPFRVDANEAWNEEEALEKLPWLGSVGCELVEQPLPAGSLDAMARLKEASPLPLIADEDAQDPEAVEELAPAFDGVNVKLQKAGGIRDAVAMIHRARAAGLNIMLGCFVESTLGITTAAHLAPLAHWCDLDGAALLERDPFLGATVIDGVIRLPDGPGLGVTPKD